MPPFIQQLASRKKLPMEVTSVLFATLVILVALTASNSSSRQQTAAVATTIGSTQCKQVSSSWQTASSWPVSSLTLGTVTYTKAQILSILSGSDSDPSVLLARHLVAALLNYASGATPSPDLATAQQWMTDNLVRKGLPYNTTPTKAPGQAAITLANRLSAYNADGAVCEIAPPTTTVSFACTTTLDTPPVIPTSFGVPQDVSFSGTHLASYAGTVVLPGVARDAVATRVSTLITNNPTLFGVSSASNLQLLFDVDDTTGLASVPFSKKPTEKVHLRYATLIGGIPVFRSSIDIYITGGTWNANIVTALPRDTSVTNTAILSQSQIIAKGIAGTLATSSVAIPVIYNVGLDYNCNDDRNRLAYLVPIQGGVTDNLESRIIDPGHGGILTQVPLEDAQNFTIYGTNATSLGFNVAKSDQAGIPDVTAQYPGTLLLYNNASVAYNYFFKTFGLDSYDGKGSSLRWRLNPGLNNSFMNYDGDQFTNGPFIDAGPLFNQSQIMVHEYTHAVIRMNGRPSGLVLDPLTNKYVYRSGPTQNSQQTSALDEGIADLFSFFQSGSFVTVSPVTPVRDATLPVTKDILSSGVGAHAASVIVSHAGYLAAHGGATPDGVAIQPAGNDVISKIFFETIKKNQVLYMSVPDFYAAVAGIAQGAAKNNTSLSGSTVSYSNCGSVLNAFAAEGYSQFSDKDSDCVVDSKDNCPTNYNPLQEDANHNGVGDVCEVTPPPPPPPPPPTIAMDVIIGTNNFTPAGESCTSPGTTAPGSGDTGTYLSSYIIYTQTPTLTGSWDAGSTVGTITGTITGMPNLPPSMTVAISPWAFTADWQGSLVNVQGTISGLGARFDFLAPSLSNKQCGPSTGGLFPTQSYFATIGSPGVTYHMNVDFSGTQIIESTPVNGRVWKVTKVIQVNSNPTTYDIGPRFQIATSTP